MALLKIENYENSHRTAYGNIKESLKNSEGNNVQQQQCLSCLFSVHNMMEEVSLEMQPHYKYLFMT